LPVTVLLVAGTVLMAAAVYNERRMHRHRQPGVTYAQATFRRDGGWRRSELFTAEGLRHQRLASGFGVPAALLWVVGLIVWGMSS
jgi:hypothetical protein